MPYKPHIDLIIHNTSVVLTLAGPDRPRIGHEMNQLSPIVHGAIAVDDGRIRAVDSDANILQNFIADEMIDAGRRLAMPGFVDCHTHLVYAGSREDEMQRKIAGDSYLDILKSGGGIHATVAAVRAATKESLFQQAALRLDQLLAHGTTTVEIKTGYGLNAESEYKLLHVIADLHKQHRIDIIPTFLGAHIVPKDQERHEYIRWLCLEAPAIKSLAHFFDVFCELEAFSLAETEQLLHSARTAGFRLKIHAGQFNSLGAAGLAADLGAVSVDHCDHLSDDEIERMQQNGTVAALLPGATFFTGGVHFPDARKLIEHKVPVAVATDFNPGSCPCYSMQMMIALACLKLKMTASEAIVAATINAAWALDMGKKVGSLEAGKKADIVILNIERPEQLPYHFGVNLVYRVIKAGQPD
jgi:imidazolonepropionase